MYSTRKLRDLFPALLFVLIILLATFLQFYRLGERSLWEDEARVVLKTYRDTEWLLRYQKNILYNLILSGWGHFGKDEFWLRIPSALFALFSLVALYELGKKVFSKRVALLAVTLLATSPFFLLESRQVKMHSLALFLSLVSVYFFIQFLKTGHVGKLIGHVGISLMAFLTHYMVFPLLLVQFLWVLLRSKEKPALGKRYFVGWSLLFFLFLPSLPSLLKRLNHLKWLYLLPKTPDILSFPLGYLGKVSFAYYLFTVGPTIFPWNFFWVLLGGLLPTFLLFYMLKSSSGGLSKLVFLVFLLPIPLLSGLRNAQPRYAFVSLPFYALLLAVSLARLRPAARTLLLSGLLLVHTYGLANYFTGHQYLFIAYLEPYRQIVQSVRERFAAGDFLLHSQDNPSFDYYFYGLFRGDAPKGELHKVDREGKVNLASWEKLKSEFPSDVKRLWFIERPPGQYVKTIPISNAEKIYRENVDFRSWLDKHFRLSDRKAYLKDPEVSKKRKIVSKFYLEERIVVSLYDLKSAP